MAVIKYERVFVTSVTSKVVSEAEIAGSAWRAWRDCVRCNSVFG